MRLLLSSAATALVMATGAYADAHSSTIDSYELTETDFYASTFMGMRVYATEADLGEGNTVAADASAEWDDIGEINDLIITSDGDVAAVIVGVGGFLGLGEKDVALSMDSIQVRFEDGNMRNRFLVVNANAAMLEEAPAFEVMDETMAEEMEEAEANAEAATEEAAAETEEMAENAEAEAEQEMADATPMDDRPMLTAPAMEREGFTPMERDQLNSEDLTGMRVYGANDEDVGEISEILMTDDGMVDRLVLDIGGFLGMGEHQIAVTPDELTFMTDQDGAMWVYIDATQEALEAQPQYEG